MPATPTALLLLLLLLAATLTTTTPLPLTPRAGAPSYVPITPPCHLTYPRTTPSSTPPQSFRPAASLASAQLYSWDRPLSDEAYTNSTALWTNCVEQCNGLSGCKSALLAYNVPGEARYGGPGGQPSIACRMYGVELVEADLVDVANGSYVRAVAGNIEGCGK